MLRALATVPPGVAQTLGEASGSLTLNGAITSASPVAFTSILLPAGRIADGTRIRGKFMLNVVTSTTGSKTFTVRFGDEAAMTNITNLYYVTITANAGQSWAGTFEAVIRGSNLIRYVTTTASGLGNVTGVVSTVAAPDFTTAKRLWFASADLPAAESMTLEDFSVEYVR